MRLAPDQYKSMLTAILSGYPSRSSLEQMVRLELDENLDEVCSQSSLKDCVFELIKWAESRGRLDALVQGSYDQNNGNSDIRRLMASYPSWKRESTFLSGLDSGTSRREYFANAMGLNPAERFVNERYDAYLEAWRSLAALRRTGARLWDEASRENLMDFAGQLQETTGVVTLHAILFEPEDYQSLEDVLGAFAEFRLGKRRLLELRVNRETRRSANGSDDSWEMRQITQQINVNFQCMQTYERLLDDIRASFFQVLSSSVRHDGASLDSNAKST